MFGSVIPALVLMNETAARRRRRALTPTDNDVSCSGGLVFSECLPDRNPNDGFWKYKLAEERGKEEA